jgi:hypothetical protein
MPRRVSIKCPECAAPLDVDGDANRIKCEYCGSVSELNATRELPAATDPKPEVKPEITSDAPGDSLAPSPATRARTERIEREDDEMLAAAAAAASVVNVGSSVAKGCRWVVFTIVTVALLGGAAVVYWILKAAGIIGG